MTGTVEVEQRRILLLGPQRDAGNISEAIAELGVEGPLAVVTAGWEERDGELEELPDALRDRIRNLGLYGRAESVFGSDTEVRTILHERYDRLRELQRVYRLRLAGQLEACRQLLSFEHGFAAHTPAEGNALYDPEIADAVLGVQALDAHHLERVSKLDEEIAARLDVANRPSLKRDTDELRELLDGSDALLIAGGHVAILLNRLRLFQVMESAESLPIMAWSGGAMVLGSRIVLFHDSPPQGPGDAEVLSPGLGLVRGVMPLPHTNHRMRLDDPARVALFARRFAPDQCICMDGGEMLRGQVEGAEWSLSSNCRVLRGSGAVEVVETA